MLGVSTHLTLGLPRRLGTPPVNTALPVITQTGSVLSVTTGTWTGDAPITYAYQFTRNGTPISGATASTYTIPDADLNALFGCIVTATNSGGNASAAAALLYVGVMDVLSVQPAANYELRRESRNYTGNAIRVRRSSDNAEANFGFVSTENLLLRSEEVNQSPWVLDNSGASNPVITANFASAPDGTMTADRVQLNKTGGTFSRLRQPSVQPSNTYTYSVYLKNNGAGVANVGIRIDDVGVNCVVTQDWQRFSVTKAATTVPDCQILLFDSIVGNDETADILVWGNQLNTGSIPKPYQPTVATANTGGGFASATQTRTNLAAIPINNNGGSTAPGVTMTVTGTGTEFGQPYVEVRWQGTASAADFLQLNHSAVGAFNPTIHAPVTPGLTYTTSIGFRLVSGTAPSGALFLRGKQCNNVGSFIGGTGVSLGSVTSTLQRGAVIGVALANAAYIQPNIYMSVNNGEVVDATIRFYAANVELGVGNARPLLQRNVPETIADIGELDAEALLNFVGGGNGFITILHEKSGNGRNATQTTPANQPQIVSNGAIVTQNGRPAIRFDGNHWLVFQGVHDAQWSLAVVGRINGNMQAFLQFGNANQFGSIFTQSNANFYRARASTDASATAPFTPGEIAVLTATYGVAQTNIWKNGIIGTPSDAAGVASNAPSYIGVLQNIYYLNGNICGINVVNGVFSTAERQLIERNRGAYYGITVA